jgi:hypothetical protein
MEILKNDLLWTLGSHLFVRDYLLSENNSTRLKIALPPPPLSSPLEGEGVGRQTEKEAG